MKKNTKLMTLVIAALLAATLLTGCGTKKAPDADKSMDAFYQLIVCYDFITERQFQICGHHTDNKRR